MLLHVSSPMSAIISALIFNAVIIPLLVPIALKGVKYKPMNVQIMLLKNLGRYGVGGIIAPFIGIKFIDLIVTPFLSILGM